MKKQNPTSLIMLLITLTAIHLAQADESFYPQSMVVITANTYQLKNVTFVKKKLGANKKIVIFNLDDVSQLEKNISKSLPAHEQEAKQVLLQRIDSIGRNHFNSTLVNAYSGIFYALKHKIDRYPVIVFDSTAVIFGKVDLLAALHCYEQWRKDQQVTSHE
jgi:integrating conjugative element protein (TIGR03757 family)